MPFFWEGHKVVSPTRISYIDFFSQGNVRCADMELAWLKCADKVGLMNSNEKCKEQFEDYQECHWQRKTRERMFAIRREQVLQNRPLYTVPKPEEPKS